MELDQLRYFTNVVRLGTYAEAAAHLSVSQPALWKRVSNLETELGVALFERVGRRVRPTTAGLQLAKLAENVIAAAERMAADSRAISRGTRGLVRLVCAPPHLERLAPAFAEFLSERPDVDLEILEVGEIDPVRLLESGTAEVVTATENPAAEGGFRIYEASVVAILPLDQSVEGRDGLPVSRLRDTPLLTAPPGYYSRVQLEAACIREGFEPTVLIESTNASALAALAEAGVGTAVTADDALPLSHRGRHPVLVTNEAPLRREIWCYWNTSNPAAEILASTIKTVVTSTAQ